MVYWYNISAHEESPNYTNKVIRFILGLPSRSHIGPPEFSRYHRAIRHIEKNANTIRMGKMANALLSNKSRDV